ncbi:MAG: formylglycine-generating enzyme family protein [Bryobacteraceae bacterium]|nr:formylglycine-generating enzyme family protein [Bryobacteraceae bacterium]
MTLRRFTGSGAVFLISCCAVASDPEMAFIPGGEFLRGRSHKLPDDGVKWWPVLLQDDQPARLIALKPFYMDKREVTIEAFAAFASSAGRTAPYNWPEGQPPRGRENLPVTGVSWDDAAAYCAWAGKRLPTEAEWERAARGVAEGAKYPWGDRTATRQDARYDAVDGPAPAGQFPPNHFGLYDMAGNVWEWCADWYGRNYYNDAPARDPQGPVSGMYRVLRGGSWADEPKYLTCAYRSWARPSERGPNIGFRCARDFPARSNARGARSE